MKVIKPITITDSMLSYSSVTEPGAGETAYNAGTNYGLGATCSVIATDSHKTYESLIAGNLGNTPADNPDKWEYTGYTNRWRVFDETRNLQTSSASPLVITLEPGETISAFALIGMDNIESVTVSMTQDAIEYYTYTEDLVTREVLDWYDFFYADFVTRPATARFDLPALHDPLITFTFTTSSGNCEVGRIAIGKHTDIGIFKLDGASMPTINYSVVDRDEFGNAVLTPRVDIPTLKGQLSIEANNLNKVRKVFKDLNGRAAVWVGIDESTHPYFDITLINGFVREKTPIPLTNRYVQINLELEEI